MLRMWPPRSRPSSLVATRTECLEIGDAGHTTTSTASIVGHVGVGARRAGALRWPHASGLGIVGGRWRVRLERQKSPPIPCSLRP